MALSVWRITELRALENEHRSELLAHANRVLKDLAKTEEIIQGSNIKFMLAVPQLSYFELTKMSVLSALRDKVGFSS